jgi:hypothetical protein
LGHSDQPKPDETVSAKQQESKRRKLGVMFLGNRRNKRTLEDTLADSLIFRGFVADFKRAGDLKQLLALGLMWSSAMIAIVTHPLFTSNFWKMKWKIGILTVAVFAAMC